MQKHYTESGFICLYTQVDNRFDIVSQRWLKGPQKELREPPRKPLSKLERPLKELGGPKKQEGGPQRQLGGPAGIERKIAIKETGMV